MTDFHIKDLENPEVDLNLHDKMTLDKDTKEIHWGENKP